MYTRRTLQDQKKGAYAIRIPTKLSCFAERLDIVMYCKNYSVWCDMERDPT
jgi:hypothetical protein